MVSVSTGNNSEQNVQTPQRFLDAVVRRWGPVVFDLAACKDSRKADNYFDIATNSLKQNWTEAIDLCPPGVAWLNPPYRNIGRWVEKAAAWSVCVPNRYPQKHTLLVLVLEGFRTTWYRDYCKELCNTHILEGYFRFVGHTHSFPKALTLLEYPRNNATPLIDTWHWMEKNNDDKD